MNPSPFAMTIATLVGIAVGTAISTAILKVLHDVQVMQLEAEIFAYISTVFEAAGLPVPTLPPGVGVVLVRRDNPKPPTETTDKGTASTEPPSDSTPS